MRASVPIGKDDRTSARPAVSFKNSQKWTYKLPPYFSAEQPLRNTYTIIIAPKTGFAKEMRDYCGKWAKIRSPLAKMTKYFTKLIIYQATLTKNIKFNPPTASTLPPAVPPKSAACRPQSTNGGSYDGTGTCLKAHPHCRQRGLPQTGYAPGCATGAVWHGALSSAIRNNDSRLMMTRYTNKIFMTPLYHKSQKYGRIQNKSIKVGTQR